MRKFTAEMLGTFVLVFFGCGAAVIAGANGTEGVGLTGIALAFGLTIVAVAYGLGAISGAHLNPAVSLGMRLAGRMDTSAFVLYVVAQVVGAILGAAVLYLIASGGEGYDLAVNGLGANGYGPGYGGGYNLVSALLFEVVATFVFVTVILGATHGLAPKGFAGLAIGLALTMIHLVGIKITGTSVNPARSIGPALFVGGDALRHLWVFLAAPLVGGALAGWLHGEGLTQPE
ncbi:MAG: aquaporin Z [Rhodobacteraceae bacterium]|jgi:aquaporin Z|nr:aquaporin Z [Paracoccaceae bacterium]